MRFHARINYISHTVPSPPPQACLQRQKEGSFCRTLLYLCLHTLTFSSDGKDYYGGTLEVLLIIRHLSCDGSGAPDTTFLALFCMHRASLLGYWLVPVEASIGTEQYRVICKTHISADCSGPLCPWKRKGEGNRITLSISYGTAPWRAVRLLARPVPEYIWWPRRPFETACIEYSAIVLASLVAQTLSINIVLHSLPNSIACKMTRIRN